ncbi:MAG: acyltransferase family protein [Sphingobium sp.]
MASGKPRNQALEALRIVAALGIVAFHAHAPGYDVAYAGLVVFLILAPMFETGANWHRRRSLRDLAVTLLIPWLFWFLVYAAINMMRGRAMIPMESGLFAGILTGPSPHLWFLPFLFVTLLAINIFKRAGGTAPFVFWLSSAAVVILLLLAPDLRTTIVSSPSPFSQWLHALPAILLGMALGSAERVRHGRWIVLPVAAVMIPILTGDVAGFDPSYPLGFVLVVIAAWLGGRMIPAGVSVEPVSRLMMGVYLVHPLALMAFSPILAVNQIVGVFIAFVASTVSVWLARRIVSVSGWVL